MATVCARILDRARRSHDDVATVPDCTSDEALVRDLRDGSAAAFTRFFEEYRATVYNLVVRIVRDRHEADDVTQEVFLKAYRQIPNEAADLRLRPWIYRVATYTCFDHLRRQRLRSTVPGPDADGLPSSVDAYEQSETAGLVVAALQTLDERQRAALVLKDLHGLHNGEIAEVLGVSEEAAKALLHRARITFRRRFAQLPAPGAAGLPCAVAVAAARSGVGQDLPPLERRRLEDHVRGCPSCRRTLRLDRAGVTGLGLFLRQLAPPAHLTAPAVAPAPAPAAPFLPHVALATGGTLGGVKAVALIMAAAASLGLAGANGVRHDRTAVREVAATRVTAGAAASMKPPRVAPGAGVHATPTRGRADQGGTGGSGAASGQAAGNDEQDATGGGESSGGDEQGDATVAPDEQAPTGADTADDAPGADTASADDANVPSEESSTDPDDADQSQDAQP